MAVAAREEEVDAGRAVGSKGADVFEGDLEEEEEVGVERRVPEDLALDWLFFFLSSVFCWKFLKTRGAYDDYLLNRYFEQVHFMPHLVFLNQGPNWG